MRSRHTVLHLALLLAATPNCGQVVTDRDAEGVIGPAVSRGGPLRQEPGTYTQSRTVVDSRGVEVTIPVDPRRVVTVSDGVVEEVMILLNRIDRLVGIGSTCLIREFEYDFELDEGETFSYRGGRNPALFLYPGLADLPLFVRPGTEMNFERLASLDPDLLILDLGACTLPWRHDQRAMERGLDRLNSLGIPTVVLMGPNAGGNPGITGLSRVIKILGEVFGQPREAVPVAQFLEESVELIAVRTRGILEEERGSVLLLGLNPRVRGLGGVGQASGTADIHSYFVEEIVRGRNAHHAQNSAVLNLEQVLALDPDVIILPTANGYHPPQELLEIPYFRDLRVLKAVRNRHVAALPWSPCNCDKRLEYPIDVYIIAKTVYPELFEDIDLAEWILGFYREAYGVDRKTAADLLAAQWLEWTLQESTGSRVGAGS